MTHEVKSHPMPFGHRWDGFKPWELRLNDRNYNPGDYLHEREWDPKTEKFTGRSILSYVALVYRSEDWPRIPKRHVIMTVNTISQGAR